MWQSRLMRPRLVETYHCMFPTGEQCRATFHRTPKEVIYAILSKLVICLNT